MTYPPARTIDGLLAPVSFVTAAVAIGYAVHLYNGAYTPESIHYLTIGLAACALGVVLPSLRARRPWLSRAAALVIAAGGALQIGLVLASAPGIYLRTSFWAEPDARVALAAAALLVGIGATGGRWAWRLTVPALCTIHFVFAIWTLKASPNPHIDVFTFHTESFKALARHENPYALTMPNIYGSTLYYANEIVGGGRLLFGYLYPPFSLLFTWAGHFFGDYRFAHAASTALAGLFMAYSRPGRIATAAAAVYWFSPRIFFVLEQGWTEPEVVMLLSASVFAACRAPRLLPLSLGLLLCSKQYAFFVVPFVFMLERKPSIKSSLLLLVKAGAVALVVTLPFVLWNVHAFMNSVVMLQLKQPLRPDALSYLVWSTVDGVPRLPLWTSFAMIVPAVALALLRAPRTPAGFAASSALVFFAFFSFAKLAFCNYYIMIIGALCCAAAAAKTEAMA
jgi:hypothetical protein